MTEIQQNRWDRLIRRAAGIVGGGSQVNDTLNELFPVMDVENVPGELLALMGYRLGWCSHFLAASAAELNHHQLFNPVDSGVLVVVTKVRFFTPNQIEQFRFTNVRGVLVDNVGNERPRDTRSGVLTVLTAEQHTAQDAVAGGIDFRVRVLTNITEEVADSNGVAILFPGSGLTISTSTVNIQSTVSFMWRERAFEPSEIVP